MAARFRSVAKEQRAKIQGSNDCKAEGFSGLRLALWVPEFEERHE